MSTMDSFSRRNFLIGALAAPVAIALGQSSPEDVTTPDLPKVMPKPSSKPLPRRKLGKNGPEITMLCLGGQSEASCAEYYDKAWSMGIRYFDLSDCYRRGQSEKDLAAWLAMYPERRSEVFIASKDHPKKLSDLPEMLEKRLAAIGTTYLDLFMIHQISAKEYGEEAYEWPKSPELKQIFEEMKAAGKIKMGGFSCHDPHFDRFLHAAAEGGFIDAILMPATPILHGGEKNNRALDACHDAGIGLMCMKVMRNAKNMPKRIPEFDELGLTTHQAALHAVWSDERISGAVVWIANDEEMLINTEAARLYKKPLKSAQIDVLRELMLANNPVLCPGCPSCKAFAASHELDLNKISRYVAYYEQDGTLDARTAYQSMTTAEKNAQGVDLAQLRDRCDYKIDYPRIVQNAQRYFA